MNVTIRVMARANAVVTAWRHDSSRSESRTYFLDADVAVELALDDPEFPLGLLARALLPAELLAFVGLSPTEPAEPGFGPPSSPPEAGSREVHFLALNDDGAEGTLVAWEQSAGGELRVIEELGTEDDAARRGQHSALGTLPGTSARAVAERLLAELSALPGA